MCVGDEEELMELKGYHRNPRVTITKPQKTTQNKWQAATVFPESEPRFSKDTAILEHYGSKNLSKKSKREETLSARVCVCVCLDAVSIHERNLVQKQQQRC